MKSMFGIILLGIGVIFSQNTAKAESLIVDLSGYLIAITTGFTGADLLLFGAKAEEGEVIVIVKGPPQDITVWQQERVGGVWANQHERKFLQVPAFYHVAATNNALETLSESTLIRHEVGALRLRMRLENSANSHPDKTMFDPNPFFQALIRNKQQQGLYTPTMGVIEERGANLFRTRVFFPHNVPTGTYTIETLLVADGTIKSAQNTPLFVNKAGLGAQVYQFAQNHGGKYGIFAVLLACLAGLMAHWLFRKR